MAYSQDQKYKPSASTPTSVVTLNLTNDGVLGDTLYPKNSDNLTTFLFSVAVAKTFSL